MLSIYLSLYIEDWKIFMEETVKLLGVGLSGLECFCSMYPIKGNK